MKKYLISFLAGLLSIGVGAGVCFAEFVQFEYGGEKIIATKTSTNRQTTIWDFTLENDSEIVIRSEFNSEVKNTPKVNVGADPQLEKNQVRVETDNKGAKIDFGAYQRGGARGDNTIILDVYQYSDFGIFRQMLEDSKDSRYYDYVVDISDCEVRIYAHPEQVSKIKMEIATDSVRYR